MSRIKISIAPLTYGAGVKGKTIESIYYGHSILGSSYAFEGINDLPDSCFVCEEAINYKECLLSLKKMPSSFWEGVMKKNKKFIAEAFSEKALAYAIKNIIPNVYFKPSFITKEVPYECDGKVDNSSLGYLMTSG